MQQWNFWNAKLARWSGHFIHAVKGSYILCTNFLDSSYAVFTMQEKVLYVAYKS